MAALTPSYGNGKSPGMRFLVCEADPMVRAQIHESLAKTGYEVVFATDAEQALLVLQSGDLPTLAVLDWTTQGMDCWQNIRHLKQRPYLYVIVLLNSEEGQRRSEALEAGADDCLDKPTDMEQLQRRVQFGSQVILERALRDSEERFRIAFEQAAIGMAMIDLGTGRFIQVNQALGDFLGYTPEELLTSDIMSVNHPENDPPSAILLSQLAKGEFNGDQLVRRYIRRDGEVLSFMALTILATLCTPSKDCSIALGTSWST